MRKILNLFSSKAQAYKKGFTLIELLVVIAIIGILASIVLVSLNSARGKGRDAQRVANLQEMAKALAQVDPDTQALVGCTNGGKVDTCTGPTPANLTQYKDPSTPLTACLKGGAITCQYALFSSTLKANDWEICTYLENGLSVGGAVASPGMYNTSTSTGGGVVSGC